MRSILILEAFSKQNSSKNNKNDWNFTFTELFMFDSEYLIRFTLIINFDK